MSINRKPTGRAMTIPGGLAVGAAVSIMITLVMSLVLTKLVMDGILEMDKIGYGSMVLLLAASFLGAVTARNRIKHRAMLVCILSGTVYYGLLLATTALFFGGQYTGVGVTGLVILGGCGTAALMTAGKGTGRKSSRRIRNARHSLQRG